MSTDCFLVCPDCRVFTPVATDNFSGTFTYERSKHAIGWFVVSHVAHGLRVVTEHDELTDGMEDWVPADPWASDSDAGS